jgi:hypothetical protein
VSDDFARADETDDAVFYAFPRKVVHIEDGAIEAVRSWYATLLPPGGDVLDLMSSWRSHLPTGLGRRTGLGMNADEMLENPQLDSFVVHDLNRDPKVPFEDDAFDAAVCTVSVQYLTQPIAVFTDVARVVRPGGPIAVAFSNRCFPTKAVRQWLYGSDAQHIALVSEYFGAAGLVDVSASSLPSPDDPVFAVVGRAI